MGLLVVKATTVLTAGLLDPDDSHFLIELSDSKKPKKSVASPLDGLAIHCIFDFSHLGKYPKY